MFKKNEVGRNLAKSSAETSDPASRVLRFLTAQGLEPTPPHYELGWLVHHDRRSFAAKAADAILMSGNRITSAQADHIVSAYRARHTDPTSPDEEDPNWVELRHQTLHLAELVACSAAATGQLGRDLDDELATLGNNGLPVATIVSSMIARSRDTEQRLASAAEKISKLREEVAAAKYDAQIDALTGLANRRGVFAELQHLSPGSTIAICDIDRFKVINDRWGHPVGDRVLKAVASVIGEICSPHLVARWGGEEFVILFDRIPLRSAEKIVENALTEISTRSFRVRETDEALNKITFSAGVVELTDAGWDDAIKRADEVLFQAKATGRNRVLSSGCLAFAA